MRLLVIGSGESSHIKINSQYVSGYHAELLLLDNGEILLTDKGSRNGTFFNGKRVQPNKDIPIKRGDLIRFADRTLDWSSVPALQMPDISKIKEMRGIGTNYRNKHQLQGEKVSRFHATLKKMNDKTWYIQDHSKNGTMINGRAIPSNMDIKLKKGDSILCAGVPVPNPYGEGDAINYKWIFVTLSIILLLCGGFYGVKWLIDRSNNTNTQGGDGKDLAVVTTDTNKTDEDDKSKPKPKPAPKPAPKTDTKDINNKNRTDEAKVIVPKFDGRNLTDEELFAKYKNSVVLILGGYYYKVKAGSYSGVLQKLEESGLFYTEWYVGGDGDVHPRKNNAQATNYTGTGFFVSRDGKIVTNLHVASPWTYDSSVKDRIVLQCKSQLKKIGESLPDIELIDIAVEGRIAYLGIIPNGAYIDGENMKKCRVLALPEDINKDVAVLQLVTKQLPDKCNNVDVNQAVVNDAEIKGGSRMFTLGFPHGLNLQGSEIKAFMHSGRITQECTKYSFGFDAASYGGASGSPIFNDKGQLIGVLNAGVNKSQGFNYGIKAVHVKDLLR